MSDIEALLFEADGLCSLTQGRHDAMPMDLHRRGFIRRAGSASAADQPLRACLRTRRPARDAAPDRWPNVYVHRRRHQGRDRMSARPDTFKIDGKRVVQVNAHAWRLIFSRSDVAFIRCGIPGWSMSIRNHRHHPPRPRERERWDGKYLHLGRWCFAVEHRGRNRQRLAVDRG